MKKTKVILRKFMPIVVAIISFSGLNPAIAESSNTNLEVNVKEFLSVSITTPATWATGDVDTFLRNKVNVSVVSNNSAGFTASMTTKSFDTALRNTAKNSITLPTLASNTSRDNFPTNRWGYSLNDTENGNGASTYSALVSSTSSPIVILSSNTASSGSKDFYFGAKADITKAAGTYIGTVVISVVSGVIDNDNPITPVNPVTPGEDQVATYDQSANVTSYTYRRTSGNDSTTTTEISSGDNTGSYTGYTPPQGVTYSVQPNANQGLIAATALGIAASIATTSCFFFLAAARQEGDDDDEEQ